MAIETVFARRFACDELSCAARAPVALTQEEATRAAKVCQWHIGSGPVLKDFKDFCPKHARPTRPAGPMKPSELISDAAPQFASAMVAVGDSWRSIPAEWRPLATTAIAALFLAWAEKACQEQYPQMAEALAPLLRKAVL